MSIRDCFVDEDRLGRTANTRAPHLGVDRHLARHVQVGAAMNIGVTETLQMAHNRHAGVRLDSGDKVLAAAGHDDIHILGHVAE